MVAQACGAEHRFQRLQVRKVLLLHLLGPAGQGGLQVSPVLEHRVADGQPAAGTEHPCHLFHRRGLVPLVQVVKGLGAGHCIEGPIRRGYLQKGRFDHFERGVAPASLCSLAPGLVDHGRRGIQAHCPAAPVLNKAPGQFTRAGADIQYPIPASHPAANHDQVEQIVVSLIVNAFLGGRPAIIVSGPIPYPGLCAIYHTSLSGVRSTTFIFFNAAVRRWRSSRRWKKTLDRMEARI